MFLEAPINLEGAIRPPNNSLKPWNTTRIPVEASGTNPAKNAGPSAAYG
jgi:hypothetical protein